jgi:hypothetical protein
MRQPWFCPGLALSVLVVLTMLAAAPTAVPSAQEAAARLPAAREVIDRFVREIGGREAVLAQSSTHVVGTVALPAAGISGEMETFHAKPNRFLQRLVLPGIGTVEEGFDGTVAWTMSPLTGPALVDGKQLEQRRFDADFYEELKPDGRYASMTTVEKTTFDERPAYKIKLVTKAGDEDFEYYDTETGLKIGVATTRESPMGPVLSTMSYGDYKQFGALRQPTSMKITSMSTQITLTVTKVEYGTVEPSTFAVPVQIKALIK